MTPLNLIFMGTPAFALPTLAALCEAGHNVVAVYSQPPRPAGRGQKEMLSPVHQYALSRNLAVYTPATLKDKATQDAFVAHKADAVVVAAYGLLLPEAVLGATALGCINVHPSLLPRWRGAAPIQRTIMAGDRETGIVIMRMDKGLDTGDMLLTKHITLPDGSNAGELHDMLAGIAGPLVLETLQGLKNGTITPKKQPDEGVTYAHKITKDDCRINWKGSANHIRQQVLGLSPNPGAFFVYKDEAVKILGADIAAIFSPATLGTVTNDVLTIQCRDGALIPTLVQRPGKKPMRAIDMLKGFPIPSGTVLE